MTRSLSIKLKAIFLLIVFSLSTPVTFACAAGLNMGYNRGHHKIPDSSTLPEHRASEHKHSGTSESHVHKAEATHHAKKEAASKESAPNDCCRDEAAKFEKVDKLSQQVVIYNLQASFVTLLVNPVFSADAVKGFLHSTDSRYLVRNHHPPIADTRIAIQSFLI